MNSQLNLYKKSVMKFCMRIKIRKPVSFPC